MADGGGLETSDEAGSQSLAETAPGSIDELMARAQDALSELRSAVDEVQSQRPRAQESAELVLKSCEAAVGMAESEARKARAAATAARQVADETGKRATTSNETLARLKSEAESWEKAALAALREEREAEARLATVAMVAEAARDRAQARRKAADDAAKGVKKAADAVFAAESKLPEIRRVLIAAQTQEAELVARLRDTIERFEVAKRAVDDARAMAATAAEAAAKAATESALAQEKVLAANRALVDSRDPAAKRTSAKLSMSLLEELSTKAAAEESAAALASKAGEELALREQEFARLKAEHEPSRTQLEAAAATRAEAAQKVAATEKALEDARKEATRLRESLARVGKDAQVAAGVEQLANQNEHDVKADIARAAAAFKNASEQNKIALAQRKEAERAAVVAKASVGDLRARAEAAEKAAAEAERRVPQVVAEAEGLAASAREGLARLVGAVTTPMALIVPGGTEPVALGEACQIGSDPACDIVLRGEGAPRKAAVLVRGVTGTTILNVGPAPDAVLVNQRPVANHRMLANGDEITIAGETFRFLPVDAV
ncbi:MAG TPA: hypothetical protein VFF73_27525 [Planctomycetota bacterium]|nr:hypothetical protein [Planctomycetota bacterium]